MSSLLPRASAARLPSACRAAARPPVVNPRLPVAALRLPPTSLALPRTKAHRHLHTRHQSGQVKRPLAGRKCGVLAGVVAALTTLTIAEAWAGYPDPIFDDGYPGETLDVVLGQAHDKAQEMDEKLYDIIINQKGSVDAFAVHYAHEKYPLITAYIQVELLHKKFLAAQDLLKAFDVMLRMSDHPSAFDDDEKYKSLKAVLNPKDEISIRNVLWAIRLSPHYATQLKLYQAEPSGDPWTLIAMIEKKR